MGGCFFELESDESWSGWYRLRSIDKWSCNRGTEGDAGEAGRTLERRWCL
jgi:hypothetical protein